MIRSTSPRLRLVRVAAGLAVGTLALAACSSAPSADPDRSTAAVGEVDNPGGEAEGESEVGLPWGPQERQGETAGEAGGEESFEARTAAEQFLNQRLAPGIVEPGAYGAAATGWNSLTVAGGAWSHLTGLKYDADAEQYRDYYSNSSGGAGYVTGRVSALAASGSYVYAGGAQGGVWRSSTGGGSWTPISDKLPALSSGDLQIAKKNGWLWYATGDSSTGAGSYVGSGVYALSTPTTGTFTSADRVGGPELESTVINAIRFSKDGTVAYAATNRGLWKHSATSKTGGWTLVFAQNKDYLPAIPTANPPVPAGASATAANAPYKNFVTDLQIDPKNAAHLVLAAAWRGGDPTNGFYESKDAGATWAKVNLNGGIDAQDIGNTSFAYSADGSKLYAVVQSMKLYNKATGTVNSYLKGVYVSNSGNPAGPWTAIADQRKLANSGSALKQSIGGKGYGPGIQSWYNQFIAVDPADPNHVYMGLEEVYETRNGGSTWKTVGPYWNFYFSCWNPSVANTATTVAGCNRSTHPDQHSVAFGTKDGQPFVYVGNDGGVYGRPLAGKEDAEGHATDWTSFNDGSIDTLQYYAVGVGKVSTANTGSQKLGWSSGVIVSGGLQDNGGSILHPGDSSMGSNFGGDGGDVLVDPKDGCNIVQEYVDLSMRVTNTCASPSDLDSFLDPSKATTYDIAPPDVAARFIAPFAADPDDTSTWIAGGKTVWSQKNGFAIRSGSEWKAEFDLGTDPATGAPHTATAVAVSGNRAYVSWCGPCNNSGFSRGIATGVLGDPSSWKQLTLGSTVPSRYIGGLTIDPTNTQHAFAVFSSFSRNWTEGPGAGVGHVYETSDGGTTWTDISANLPDVPTNSIKRLANGTLVVGTDLGVAVRPAGQTQWKKLGSALPLTVVTDVEAGPDGKVYVATFGRGLWALPYAG